ncbi:MAG: cytochrome c oxidase accessory protein CcoG, partial [Candidatus Hydrogenedentota bacterium]
INGHPFFLLDIPNRIFHIFGLTIWPQEMYFLHLTLLLAGISLFFFTSLFGRIWCAYGCPQTIMTEVYDFVGRRIAGNKYGKKRISKGLKAAVYIGWILTSLILSLIFIAYFKDIYAIFREIAHADFFLPSGGLKTWVLFWIAFTALATFIWGYFRENACKYVCPYGRFQTALLDAHSPVVTYDVKRGEPRRQKGQKIGEHEGDCTACNLCQIVCPTGIDIREGLQVGCIRCGLCIDACTIEMSKFGKKTLIDMTTMDTALQETGLKKYIRGRTVTYGTLFTLILGLFIYLLAIRVPMKVQVVPSRDILPTYIPSQGFQNIYEVDIANMSFDSRKVHIQLISPQNKLRIASAVKEIQLPPEKLTKVTLLVQYPAKSENENPKSIIPFRIRVQDIQNKEVVAETKTIFSFP